MLVQEKLQEICEECFERFAPQKAKSVLPIGIVLDKFGSSNRNKNSNNDGDGDGDSKNNSNNSASASVPVVPDILIQMCRLCRKDYYTKHPEAIPRHLNPFLHGNSHKIMPRIDGDAVRMIYGLSTAHIRSPPSEDAPPCRPSIHADDDRYQRRRDRQRRRTRMRIFQEADVLQLARKVHGGDVGIAHFYITICSSCHGFWNKSEPQDNTAKRRQLLLRSLMYDRGIVPPTRSVACEAFVERGKGVPEVIVEDLDVENWYATRTNYYHPNKIGNRQEVRLRLTPDRPQTWLEALFHGRKGG